MNIWLWQKGEIIMSISIYVGNNYENAIVSRSNSQFAPGKNSVYADQSLNSNPLFKSTLSAKDVDRAESDKLLLKSRISETKLDAMGEYFGSMQTAKEESGRDGFTMFRRINSLIATERNYRETSDYKSKKDKDTFVSDQIEAMREKQDEIEALKAKKAEQEDVTEQDTQDVADVRNAVDKKADKNSINKSSADSNNSSNVSSAKKNIVDVDMNKQKYGSIYSNDLAKKSKVSINSGAMFDLSM